MYFRKLNSRLIERRDDSENDSYMSLSAEKQSLQNNSLNNSKKERKKKKEDETRVDKQVFLSSVIQTTISRLSYIFPEWTNSRILEQFEHSPDILTTFHNQTNFDKKLFFFVFLPTKRGLSLLTCYSMQCPEHCPLNTTNNRFFIRVLYTSTYQQLGTKKVPRYKKKKQSFENLQEF